jgi:hypothetical protein
MSKVLKKLRDKSGASIFISLLFFLFCLTIGGIIHTTSTANAGRLRNSRQAQQDYLTVSSAALLLRSICVGSRLYRLSNRCGRLRPQLQHFKLRQLPPCSG